MINSNLELSILYNFNSLGQEIGGFLEIYLILTMVDLNSPTFQFFEKVGYVVGKMIRYTSGAAIIGFIGNRFLGSPPELPTPPT